MIVLPNLPPAERRGFKTDRSSSAIREKVSKSVKTKVQMAIPASAFLLSDKRAERWKVEKRPGKPPESSVPPMKRRVPQAKRKNKPY